MWKVILVVLRLLKRLLRCQVFATLTASSVRGLRGLRILASCYRSFLTKIRGLLKHNGDARISSSNAQCDTVLTSVFPSYKATPLLPVCNEQAASSTPDPAWPPAPQCDMPIPIIDQEATFTPCIPSEISRYVSRPLVDMARPKFTLSGFTRHFPHKSCSWLSGTDDWKSYVHPEGALYLYNNKIGAFTEAIISETTFHEMNEHVKALYDRARSDPKGPEANNIEKDIADGYIELVVQREEAKPYKYYFVDHKIRRLFWLDKHSEAAEDLFDVLPGVYDLSHMGYALEYEYWTHCERYPNHKMDRGSVLVELRELVMYASAEIIVSDTSLSPFGADELSKILELVNHLNENTPDKVSEKNTQDNDFLHSNCVIARFMHYFSKAKFFNFCGLPCARLDADISVYPEVTNFHPLFSSLYLILDFMLFLAPRARLKDIRRVWVDESIVMPRWKDFNNNLMTEWTGITIYSTVMLAVDVSFLAVPNVSIGQSQSIEVISTYLSIIFITGSLIISLLLARQYQAYGFGSADRATEFLVNRTDSFLGVKALATVHSLPFALLMWGMIYFAIALLYNVFKSTTSAMLASVVSGCTVIIIFISWFFWTGRGGRLLKRILDVCLARISK